MKKVNKYYKIEDITVSFELDEVDANHYMIPVDIPKENFENTPIEESLMMISKKNFEEDMQSLLARVCNACLLICPPCMFASV